MFPAEFGKSEMYQVNQSTSQSAPFKGQSVINKSVSQSVIQPVRYQVVTQSVPKPSVRQ